MGSDRVEMKFELVPVPVEDIDRAKETYVEKLGFDVDVDDPEGNTWTLQEMPWRSQDWS